MWRRSFSILAFLVLGLFLTGWSSQPVSARLAEKRFIGANVSKERWVALPLLMDNIPGELAEIPDLADNEGQNIVSIQPVVERTFVWNPPGETVVPILMYHHVGDFDPSFRYAVSVQSFQEQMKSLQTWGYTTIPIASVIKAMTEGAYLPERPIVITFDDGYMDVYENALPIMQQYGFEGVAYIIAGQVEIGGFMHADQLKELRAAGWEIGSHTYNHVDLRQADTDLQLEIVDAKNDLEALIDGPVDTFAFPYGLTTPYATSLVEQAGFRSAVGLGGFSQHVPATGLYLSRIEVQGDFDLKTFADLLPWVGPPVSDEPFLGLDQ